MKCYDLYFILCMEDFITENKHTVILLHYHTILVIN